MEYNQLNQAKQFLQDQLKVKPKVGLILGSGLGVGVTGGSGSGTSGSSPLQAVKVIAIQRQIIPQKGNLFSSFFIIV